MVYTLEYIKTQTNNKRERKCGAKRSYYDSLTKQWRMTVQLDDEAVWFLSVFFNEDGTFSVYSLDRELEDDSHFQFTDEVNIRKKLQIENDEDLCLDEVFIHFLKKNEGDDLLRMILPFVTSIYQF